MVASGNARQRGVYAIFPALAIILCCVQVFTGVTLYGQKTNYLDCSPPSSANILTASAITRTREDDSSGAALKRSPAPVRFLMILGVEGVGHHFFAQLFFTSPSFMHMQRKTTLLQDLNTLSGHLYNARDEESALFSAGISKDAPHTAKLVQNVVDDLTSLQRNIVKFNAMPNGKIFWSPNRTTIVPVNSLFVAEDQSGMMSGMMSFPNFGGHRKHIQHPDLGAFYEACDQAGVLCEHIFLYRDPYETIRSTTMNRQHDAKHRQIQTLSNMLDIIHGQLLDFPDRLAACWNFSIPLLVGGDNSALHVGDYLGFNNRTLRSVYSQMSVRHDASMNITAQEKLRIVPSELNMYMNRMIRTNERAANTCKQQFRRLKEQRKATQPTS